MSVISDQISKAERRLDFDLNQALAAWKTQSAPGGQTTPGQVAERRRFLRESLGDNQLADLCLERLIGGNELQPINYLARGSIAARAVARITIREASGRLRGRATGFLIAPQVLLTNHHVFPSRDFVLQSEAEFEYETNLADVPTGPVGFRLLPDQLFFLSEALDFCVVAVEAQSVDGRNRLADYPYLPLLEVTGKSIEGEWLTIVQHPAGERKQLCVRENRLIKRGPDALWYSTDTLAGSSGSPVFNNDWFVVALHHSGIAEKRNGLIQTIDGQDYDPKTMDEQRIKWVANEGIRASRIAQALRENLPDHPLLEPMYRSSPADARVNAPSNPAQPSAISTPYPKKIETTIMNNLNPSSPQTIMIPLQITLTVTGTPPSTLLASAAASPVESQAVSAEAAGKKAGQPKSAAFDVPFVSDYHDRKGYNPDFLGKAELRVNLPRLSPALEHVVTPLLAPQGQNKYVLNYHNFSVAMHRERRFALYSAANVDFSQRYAMSRPTDVWREDHRIPLNAQVSNFLYASNKFDRGHLTRREDLEFGPTPLLALQSAADTCHWTNCTPQHERFNQNKEIWQGIERHVLENAIVANHFKAQVITGPVLDEDDPKYKDIQYPLQFWKVVAALNSAGQLFATAYLASQAESIAKYGIEAAVEPFGPYKTFQVPIAEIERLTGLTFTSGDKVSLSRVDPLSNRDRKLRRRRVISNESALAAMPEGYLELGSVEDIVTQ